ncbi:MAG: hypothetical protein IPN29_06215 [Saprospiraceae bacterium]|nr:hypothetical protein [Saprospiraceae bacterium]
MKQAVLCVLIFTAILGHTQVGIRYGYGSSSFDGWEGHAYRLIDVSRTDFLNRNMHFGVDYWFRLKKRRIEFLPELSYTRFSSSTVTDINYALSSANFYFNVQVYLLDLQEDCDCPTFSKQGPTLNKGFFVHIAPSVRYFMQKAESTALSLTGNTLGFGIRGGIGLDIGLSDFITITPMLNVERTTRLDWKNLTLVTEPDQPVQTISSDHSAFSGAIRLGLRLNKGKRRR